MITNEQVISQMKRTLGQIEASEGQVRKQHVAKLLGFCELLLNEPIEQANVVTKEQSLDRQMAAFLGAALDDDVELEADLDSLLDF